MQEDLADLLLARGARPSGASVRACLANGCPEAAEYLARRGARVDLEDAAGIGRLDLVEQRVDTHRLWDDVAWRQEAGRALMMAVWYGHIEIIGFLLDLGFDPAWQVKGDGESRTALHVASYAARPAIVDLLLRRGAPVNAIDDRYGTTPLVWALHAWLAERRQDHEAYRDITRMLADAGALVKAKWIDDDLVRADRELFDLLARRAESG